MKRKIRTGGLILFQNKIWRCEDKCLKPYEGEFVDIEITKLVIEIYFSQSCKYLGRIESIDD